MDASSKTEFPREWLTEVVSYFLAMDFFRQWNVSDLTWLVSHIEARANSGQLFGGGLLNPSDEKNSAWKAEQILLTLDKDRVWFVDAEADFQNGDYWYLRALLDWTHIARKCFQPQNLSEIWLPRRIPDLDYSDVDEQPIRVSFTLNEKEISVDLEELGGWFDSTLVKTVNDLIYDTGLQFASVQSICDQSAFICCLTMSEIQKLKTERGWKFHEELFHDAFNQI